ncbi:PREDICTED: transmembrane protein 87A [Nicrophorus vespilloides]|uniref:Transmembrane protein 87A n=1 Tax=Nicrophorus vespilloides TaxID=110193 RepID=A0ABM1NC16_NICVS|nr:PREDICTED: transmembrane protein 87A [Nicrophorus vespilloides]XP_017784366.1 PREDICTED: transmembrane protein 87A [Nicrophorus vespilloides]
MPKFKYFLVIFLLQQCLFDAEALPDEGKWDFNLTVQQNYLILSKSLYQGAHVFIRANCETITEDPTNITVTWVVVHSVCWDYSDASNKVQDNLQKSTASSNMTNGHPSSEKTYKCWDHISIEKDIEVAKNIRIGKPIPVFITPKDGIYVLGIKVAGENYNLDVHIEMKNRYGYLSAADWPLLPFYGFMCIIYVMFGLMWLVMSFLQWRDLLRVQFWIGGVILLGMLEKATFYAEYQSINHTGSRVQGAMLFAEWVSCGKRTLARMLVVIVSLGFGIVKPRLGAALHRVVGVGMLYFFLAASESYLRVTRPKNDQNKDVLVASVPLAVLDSAICWWIFSALVNTMRTLRLRRNEVKLTLYKHFTNTLIFSVAASVIFMLYSIKTHRIVACLKVWKDLWLEEAYWHILFSSLLLVIIILWRPTNNNQRYAFVPLLETGDDEEEEHLVNDAYGVKVRIHKNSVAPKQKTIEEEIKWLEENVNINTPLQILDSDDELVNTRFEVSKMQ